MVKGQVPLAGEITIGGSKNAVLPMMAACILHKGVTRICNCPWIKDVQSMIDIMQSLGCKIQYDRGTLTVDAGQLKQVTLQGAHVRSMRSSIVLLGALMGRVGEAQIAYPGGCHIGARPIDYHIQALRSMNVTIEEKEVLHCYTGELCGAEICFAANSVGATENVLLAAVLATGVTHIRNAAKEPEILALCRMLKQMGADITGDGTNDIYVRGVKELRGITINVVSDRIIAGTYMTAVAATGGKAVFHMDCIPELESLIRVLEQMGNSIYREEKLLVVEKLHKKKKDLQIVTGPYPEFPTDMQSQIMAALTIEPGLDTIVETVFESRFHPVSELRRLGAKIDIIDNIALIEGVSYLSGQDMQASDLRGGAALIIGGLLAEGESSVSNIEYIERGYEDICRDLRLLGADIRKIEVQ